MPPINTKITPQRLNHSLERLDTALAKAADDKGNVNVKDLERRLNVTAEVKGKDPGTEAMLDALKDKFTKTETRWVGSGCDSHSETVRVAPENLSKADVKNVRQALMDAKKKVAGMDTHKDNGTTGQDGVISDKEAAKALAARPKDLAEALAQEALQGTQQDIKDATRPKPVHRDTSGC